MHAHFVTKTAFGRSFFILTALLCWSYSSNAQSDIYQMMERNDLKIDSIESFAKNYFTKVGKAKGSGYKQYQRWLFERKFHLNNQGFYISPEVENETFQQFSDEQKKNKSNSIIWSELGPKSWNYINGWNPGIGRVSSIAIHPADTTKIYVCSPGGGIWKSSNSGSSWIPLMDNTSLSWMNIYHVCIDPSNPNTLYASMVSGGVLKSTNAGISWTLTGTGPTNPKKVIIHPTNSNIVFVCASNGVYRSTNGGISWNQVCTTAMEDIEFNPSNLNIMYASGSGIWRSSNNGISWNNLGASNGITTSGRTMLGVSPADASIVYAVQANGGNFGKLYKSLDSGVTFNTMITGSSSNGTNYFGYEIDGTGGGGQANYDMAICVNKSNVNEVYIAGIICWKSKNGGSQFEALTEWYYPNSTGYNHADVHALEWVNNTLYSGSDGGIFKSIDYGDNWTDLSLGLGIRQVYRIACSKTNPNVIAMGAQDNGSSLRQNSGVWKDWVGADGTDCVISPTDANVVIGTSQYGDIYKTTNAGSSVSYLSSPTYGNWITPIAMHPTSHDTLYGGWSGFWKSNNGGSNWSKISSSISTALDVLVIAPSNPKYIYGSAGTTLYRSNNGGASWSSVSTSASITSLCVSPKNPEKIWITCNSTGSRVLMSTNMGTNFTDIAGNLPNMAARSIVVDDNTWEGLYVGMNIGVYYRDNINTDWVLHGSGLPIVAINEVEIQKSSGKLRVATYGRGVWESDLQNKITCNLTSNLKSSNITTNEATLSWTIVAEGIGYILEYKINSASSWNRLSLKDGNVTLNDLSSGSVYDWRIRTTCTSDSSAFAYSTFTTLSECLSPGNVSASNITSNSVQINWSSVSGAVSYTTEYKLSTSAIWSETTTLNALSQTITGLSPGTNYDWHVRTNCSNNNSLYAASGFTTTSICDPPTGPSISEISANSAVLSWNAPNNALSYSIDYKTSASSTWIPMAKVSSTSYKLSGLIAGTSYDCRVQTNCDTKNSIYLQSGFTTLCEKPIQLATSGILYDEATVSWLPLSGIESYTLQYKLSNSSKWDTTVNTSLSNYKLKNLLSGTKYIWQVRANCSNGNSIFEESTFNTLCVEPSNPNTTNLTSGSAQLNWSGVNGAVSYDLQYKLSTSKTWSSVQTTQATNLSVSGLTPGLYNWRVTTNCSESSAGYLNSEFLIYCASQGASADNEYIKYINLGSINRKSGNDGGKYDGLALSTNLRPGNPYTIFFTPGFPSTPHTLYWSFFIDYNRNGSFAETNELIGQKTTTDSSLKSMSFSVPNSALLGKTRLRILMKNGSYATCCNAFRWGEAEEYSVILTTAPFIEPGNPYVVVKNEFAIYPVPASDVLYYTYSLPEGNFSSEIAVTDITGKTLFYKNTNTIAGNYSDALDLSHYSKGVYFFRFSSDEGTIVKRFTVIGKQ